jgi:hypothetical protein
MQDRGMPSPESSFGYLGEQWTELVSSVLFVPNTQQADASIRMSQMPVKTSAVTSVPSTGFMRLPQIIGNPRAKPPLPPIVPVCRTTWWAGVKSGRYPKPIKLSLRVTVWRVEDILALIAQPEKGACHD